MKIAIILLFFSFGLSSLFADDMDTEKFKLAHPQYEDKEIQIDAAGEYRLVSVYTDGKLTVRIPYLKTEKHGLAEVYYTNGGKSYQLFANDELKLVITHDKSGVVTNISMNSAARGWNEDESGFSYYSFGHDGTLLEK